MKINTRNILCAIMALWSISAYGQQESAKTFQSITNEEFAAGIDTKGTVVLDVRTPPEYASGHLPEAINIDVKDPEFSTKCETQLDKEKIIYLYCRSGVRSKKAAAILVEKGYKVYELNKGISGWNGKIE